VRAVVNAAVHQGSVGAPSGEAVGFHAALEGYGPTPVRELPGLAAELGLAAVALKDETHRLGLPAFKVLGASWAVERALRECAGVATLVAASAGNHGRAVAHVAARRGLRCRIVLPARAAPARREAIAREGAEVVVVDGPYEAALARAATEAAAPGALEIADTGADGPASWVIDGYATLFAELARAGSFDVIVVPVGVGSLAAAAARFAAASRSRARVIGVEPATAACLGASLAAGRPTAVPTPGTEMAGMDCAEVSPAAWPVLRDGVHGTIAVDDREARVAMRELAAGGLEAGSCGGAPLAALRALAGEPACAELRAAVGLGATSRVLLVVTEGPTDPDGYRAAMAER
jgi:diaminopropionate ammonia-lyase